MTAILCAGPRGEVLFNRRRVSRDGAVLAELLAIAEERGLRVTPYSARLLDGAPGLTVSEDPLSEGEGGESCFLEDTFETLYRHAGEIRRLVLYRWDKTYPLDQTFDLSRFLEAAGAAGTPLTRVELRAFQGRTHETITREVYETCEN